eukprot:COSAG03_NODE_6833_length_999_cov_0.727778_1_plen_123_part_00
MRRSLCLSLSLSLSLSLTYLESGTRKTCRIEGIPAIYKGLSASCLYGGPYVGLNMSINDMMKRLIAGEASTDSLSLGSKLLAGSVAATTAQTIVFPLDTLRRRLQVRACSLSAHRPPHKNVH